ncbi:MAG TPA: hypothetical protein VIV60_06985 [Polyangiaceae bacterium]
MMRSLNAALSLHAATVLVEGSSTLRDPAPLLNAASAATALWPAPRAWASLLDAAGGTQVAQLAHLAAAPLPDEVESAQLAWFAMSPAQVARGAAKLAMLYHPQLRP